MKDFQNFTKNAKNHVNSNQQNTADIDGYYFEGKDNSQHAILIENQKSTRMNLMSI